MLNKELLFNFVRLLDCLVDRPSQYARQIEQIGQILRNMRHLLNLLRVQQVQSIFLLVWHHDDVCHIEQLDGNVPWEGLFLF